MSCSLSLPQRGGARVERPETNQLGVFFLFVCFFRNCVPQPPKPQVVEMDPEVTEKIQGGLQEYVSVWAPRERHLSLHQEAFPDLVVGEVEGDVKLEVLSLSHALSLAGGSALHACFFLTWTFVL